MDGPAPLAVAFTDTSTGSPNVWRWDFGNGNGSALQHPTYTYDLPGLYTVTLTASNAALESGTASAQISVKVFFNLVHRRFIRVERVYRNDNSRSAKP